jgi:hypothetical protein
MNCVPSLIRSTDHLYLFSRVFFPVIGRNAFRPCISFSIFYECCVKWILWIMWKMVYSVGYEYNGICAENSHMPFVLVVAWENMNLICVFFNLNSQKVPVWWRHSRWLKIYSHIDLTHTFCQQWKDNLCVGDWYWNCGCANNEQPARPKNLSCHTAQRSHTRIWGLFGELSFVLLPKCQWLIMTSKAFFPSKALREHIEESDGRDAQNMWEGL